MSDLAHSKDEPTGNPRILVDSLYYFELEPYFVVVHVQGNLFILKRKTV